MPPRFARVGTSRFPAASKSTTNRGKALQHDPERIRALFEMSGATWCEWHAAPEGYIVHARFADPDRTEELPKIEERDLQALFKSF